MLGWPRLEKNGHPMSHDLSPGRLALTTKMTTGVDVTGRPSLAVGRQVGRPTAVQTLVYTSAQRLNSILSGTRNQ